MPNELELITCPNPKCHRKIEEPILLNNLSRTPTEQYYACPHCFMKVKVHVKRGKLAGSFLIASGLIILAWICCFTIQEMTIGGKDIALIFFGSRTGEAVSLGIGMRIIHYFVIATALFFSGLLTFLQRRSKAIELRPSATIPEKEKDPSKCPYNFGYLKKLAQNNTSIPEECLRCFRMVECSSS